MNDTTTGVLGNGQYLQVLGSTGISTGRYFCLLLYRRPETVGRKHICDSDGRNMLGGLCGVKYDN